MRKIIIFVVLTFMASINADDQVIAQTAGAWDGLDAAREHIETNRKGDLTVIVCDRKGNPVPNAKVVVTMNRHAFPFGSCINVVYAFNEDGPKPEAEQYLKVFVENFNAAVVENSMKWTGFSDADGNANTTRRAQVRQCMDWLDDHDIELRGHNVLWPNWQFAPKYLKDLSPDRLRDTIYHRIDEAILFCRGRLTDWDLVNEPAHHRAFMDILGEEEVVYWYRRAHELDPGTPMYVNQYDVLNGDYHSEYKRWIELLIDGDSPLGGIGIQGHVKTDQFIGEENLEKVWNILNEYAAYGLPIKITEFDCEATNGEDRQAECLENALTLFFSHPSVEGFMLWGFWDGRHWRNTERYGLDKAGLWCEDWSEKPAAQTWRRLIFKEWRTNETVMTNIDGRATVRGFLGDYRIVVDIPGGHRNVLCKITRSGNEISVTMP
ncbi:MAG: endo-1,4-beta-xylanase [Candidatus Latescibacteria bacterium]|nr:endo-1,4-beta-xylanase [Candidatus Latescibacterota bacterium]